LKLARIIVGFRDDVQLQQHWWHRLLKVLFVLSGAAASIFLVFGLNEGLGLTPDTQNVHVTNNLGDFTKKSSPSTSNTVPEFLALPGELGSMKNGRFSRVNWYDMQKAFCSADLVGHAEEVAHFVTKNSSTPAEKVKPEFVVKVREGLKKALEDRPGEEQIYCLIDESVPFKSAEIVKYQYTQSAIAGHWAKVLSVGAAMMAVVSLLVMNLYFRAFVYIICGPRKMG